ncbi:MAG: 6-phosphogluconolactonase [Anaerolineaceae bacterium]|jgi:6-phosphogluconolactonase|nr:6-phosphogluconolactonase [Anaerolineaceae bacterium]
MKPKLRIFPDREALAFAGAHHFLSIGQAAILHRGRFMVAFSGGTTPKLLFQRLRVTRMQDALNWDLVHIFWGDERCVPPDDAESNYRMAREALLDDLPIPAANIHRFLTELPPEEAARQYEKELQASFGLPDTTRPPVFDLILLGMGSDGHTASLFPGTTALDEQERWAAAVYVEKLDAWRVTLTLPVLNAARDVLFLVSGEAKAQVLQDVLAADEEVGKFPAQLVQPGSKRLYWFADCQAAAQVLISRRPQVHWHV